MANDLFSSLKVYLSKVTDGEKSPADMAAALNTWVRDSGESIKAKIEEEVESSVSKMGFVKKEDFDRLQREVNLLRAPAKRAPAKKAPAKKAPAKKAPAKKAPAKKAVKK